MRGFRIAAVLAAAIALAGCGEQKSADYLGYQKAGAQFLCKITQGDGVSQALMEIGDGLTLTFREPESMAGYRFEQSDSGIVLSYGDLEIPMTDAELPRRIFALFSLSPGDFLSASRERVSGEEITAVHFTDGRLLRLSSDGRPLMLEDDALTVDLLPAPETESGSDGDSSTAATAS